jgi:predicted SAM-dependent methyltransferase
VQNGESRIVNFGCGPHPTANCINIDGSPTVLLAHLPLPARFFGPRSHFVAAVRTFNIRYCNVRRLAFPESSLDGFFAEHVLEHLSRKVCIRLLKGVLCWLKPAGVLRVVLPDLRRLAEGYVSNQLDADEFVTRTRLVPTNPAFGSRFGYNRHLWMYDAQSFMALLREIGFRNVEETAVGRSRLNSLASLDRVSRKNESFYVEAEK